MEPELMLVVARTRVACHRESFGCNPERREESQDRLRQQLDQTEPLIHPLTPSAGVA